MIPSRLPFLLAFVGQPLLRTSTPGGLQKSTLQEREPLAVIAMDATYCEPGPIDEFLNVAALILLDDLKIALILMWSFEIPENEAGCWFQCLFLIPSVIIPLCTFGIWDDGPPHYMKKSSIWAKCFTLFLQDMVLEDVGRRLSFKNVWLCLIFRVHWLTGMVILGSTWQACSTARTVSSALFLLVPNWLMSWPMHPRSLNPLPGRGTDPMNWQSGSASTWG